VRALIAAPGWFKERRENREFIAVNNVTPERLIAAAGHQSETKPGTCIHLLPETSATSQRTGNRRVQVQQDRGRISDWVFTSMQDSSRGTEYDSPSAKVAALSCLDSKK